MPPALVTAIGIAAGLLTTGAWVPQIIKTWKSKQAGDFSWTYLAAFSSGVSLWAIYGFIHSDIAIIAANVATLLLVLSVAYVKLRDSPKGSD